MNESRKKFDPEDARSAAERRRVAKVVHDERGNASVEWRAAATGQERPVLEVLGEGALGLKSEEVSYDPYARSRPRRAQGGKRTDLRKLSEWIKKMRELEELKRAETDPDEA
ncbi:MAG: hypothetical protein JO158_04615 [Gammaproteobacteria bacterium]|nr:hypothetical protein [Gammaproteobacteria bacterium]MBV9724187.1 hypothetical protein [Gammaproteobacteria bacterium]